MMSLFTLLRRYFQNAARKSSRHSKPKRPRWDCYRLTLDRLEERLAPAVYDYTGTHLGGTYGTIQAAVNAANPGDTILVDAGTYSESVTVNKTLTIEGAQHGVDARTRGSANESIVDGTNNGGMTPFYVTANDVVIDGFTIQGATNPNQFGFGILLGAGTSGAHVVNDILQNNIAGLSLANAPGGDQALIQHDLFQNNNATGPVSGTGIYTDEFNAGGNLANVLIDSNTFTNNNNEAVIFGATTDNSFPGTSPKGTNLTISNNLMDGNGGGVFIGSASDASITGNSIINSTSGGDAIFVAGGVNGLTINGNDIAGNGGAAVDIGPDVSGSAGAWSQPNTNVTVSLNSITNNAGGGVQIAANRYTGTLNASGNWWGTTLGATPTSSLPDLSQIEALNSAGVHVGSFLDSGSNTATVGFAPAATTEMWVPQTAATTGLKVVDGSIQDGINTALSGMTVRVAADTYAGNVLVDKPVTLLGAEAGIDPVHGRSGPETVVEPGLTSNFGTDSVFLVESSNVTIDGFTIQGSNPSLSGGGFTLDSGTTVYAAAGVSNSANVNSGGSAPSTVNISDLTVQNNIIQDFTQFGVYGDTSDGTVSTGNLITNNVINDVPNNGDGGYVGEGVLIYDNFYADVKGNAISNVRTGIQTGNNYLSAGSFVPSISNNTVSAYVKGIYYNLQYESASGFTIADNTITQADGSVSPAYNVGLLIQSIQSSVQSNITGNDVSGFLYGVEFAGNNTTSTVTVHGGQLNGNTYGVWATNNDYFYPANYNTTAALDGVTITNSTKAGIWVDSTSPNSDNTFSNTTNTVSLAIGGDTTVTGGTVGLKISGSLTAITGDTLNDTKFSGQTGNYITLTGGAMVSTTLDASGATFDGNGGPHTGTTLSQFYGIEDKVTDYLDDPTLGYVRLNAGNVYVAHSSEAASAGAVQRGVNAALAGDIVYLQAGTYVANGTYTVSGSAVGAAGQEVAGLNIDKPLTLLGPNSAYDPNTGLAPANDQAIIVPGASDPNPYDPNAVIVMLISFSNVTVQGITVDGINPNLTHYSDPGTVSGHSGYVTAYGSTAPIDAAEDVASYADVSNVTLRNNLIQNAGYLAVDFVNGTDYSGAATTGSLITSNLIRNTSDAYFYGDGVNLYDNFYADVTHNVIQNVRTGVQLGNYSQANPNADPALFANVSDNTISADRIGLWYNLFYESSSPFTFANNTISALPLAGNSKWDGVFISSIQGTSSGTFQGNIIDGTKASPSNSSEGYDVWNTPTTGQLLISGGSVTGVDYGVWVNTYEAYGSAADNTQVTVSGLDVTASQIGVYVEASPQNTTGATASATVTGSSITGNATGIDVEGGSLTARNNFITGNTGPAILVGGAGTPSVTVQDSDLSSNGSTVVRNNNGSITVDAAEDYWGSAYVTPAAVAGLVSGQVNFEAILTTGDADGSAPGFQPDTTKLAVDISTGIPMEGAPYTLNLAPSNPTANNATITQWVINWGDGTANTTVSSPSILASVTHVYAEDGKYTITATATDELGNTAPVTAQVTVQDVPVSVQPGQSQVNAVEGGDTNLVILASFTDPAGAEAVTDYSATVDWGDGTIPDNTFDAKPNIFIVQAGSTFLVEGSHLYAKESPDGGYKITTTIHHETAPDAVTNTLRAFVSDVAPTITGTAQNQSTTDHVAFSPLVTVTIGDVDPNQQLTTTVAFDAANGVFTPTSLTDSEFTLISGNSATAQYQFVGTASATTAAIRQLVFQPTKYQVVPGQAVRTVFTISVSDGILPQVMDSTTSVNATAVAGVDTLPFSDNFNRPDAHTLGQNWNTNVGALAVKSNVAVATGSPFSIATLNGLSKADVTEQVSVNLAVGQWVGLVARYSGPGDRNMYFGALSRTSSGLVASLWRNVNGTWTRLFSGKVTDSGKGTLRFDVVGTSLKLFYNGVLVAYANDNKLTSGTVGMRASAGATLDNFGADSVTPSSASLPYSGGFINPAADGQLSNSWLTQAGDFQVTGNQARAIGGAGVTVNGQPAPNLNLATLNSIPTADVNVSATVTLAAGQWAGLVARYSGPGDQNMYFGALSNTGSGQVASLWRNLNGTWTMLASKPVNAASGMLQLVVTGSTLTLSFNGSQVLNVTDSTISEPGSVGMRASTGAVLDGFVV